jgi:predicted transcriptional regulator
MPSDADDLAARLERIQKLTDEFLSVQGEPVKARQLADRIKREIDHARAQLKSLIQPT